MIYKRNSLVGALYLSLASLVVSTHAAAVGGGNIFNVNEVLVPGAMAHAFQADSLDYTYHACTNIEQQAGDPANDNYLLRERGYFWISSYQDADSVADSQINYFLMNGYHIYGTYKFEGPRVGSALGPLGNRRAYQIQNGSIQLYVDPIQDTNLGLFDCQLNSNNRADDYRIGGSNSVLVGEKSEKDGLANGDFEVIFNNWIWDTPDPIVPGAGFNLLVFNANVTDLGGSLDDIHWPEGSGNLFWRAD